MSRIDWNNDVEVDEFLRQGLLLANEPVIETAMPVVLSEKYVRWERQFLVNPFGYAKRVTQTHLSRFARAAVVALLVLSVSFGTLLAVNPDVRAAVYNWFVERFQMHDTYRFTGEQDDQATRNWEPSWLPEGYVEVERIDLFGAITINYVNNLGIEIELEYTQMTEGSLINRDNEDREISQIEEGGVIYNIYRSLVEHKRNFIIWADEESNFMFSLASFESIDVLMQIAQGIR